MRVSQTFLAALSAALAQAVFLTNDNYDGIVAGEPYTVGFADAVGPTELYFATGTPDNVEYEGNLIGTQQGATGSFTWTPASGGSFAFVVKDLGKAEGEEGAINYSGFFTVEGDVATTTSDDDESSTKTTITKTTTHSSTVTTTCSEEDDHSSSICTTGYNTTTHGPTAPHTQVPSATGPGELPPTDIISGAANIASPLALVLLALGALMTLN